LQRLLDRIRSATRDNFLFAKVQVSGIDKQSGPSMTKQYGAPPTIINEIIPRSHKIVPSVKRTESCLKEPKTNFGAL
jgi:hypothetical protein